MDKQQPPFVGFEGIDKCGKGTQTLRAVDKLRQAWGNVVFLREPNDRDNPTGKLIRRILQHEIPAPPNLEFQRLFVFDRAADIVCTILPGLASGRPVVADRFALSTIAYGALAGLQEQYIQMHREVLGPWLRWPDLTIILDIPAEIAMERLAKENGKPDYFEKLELLARIRQAYLDLGRQSNPPWAPSMKIVVVDATGTKDQVQEAVQAVLAPYLS